MSFMTILKTRFKRLLITIPLLYTVLLVAGCAWQRKLLYFPHKTSRAIAEQEGAANGFSAWVNLTNGIIGWKMTSSSDSSGSVLILHGNAGNAVGRDYIAQPIFDAGGIDVYVLEYPGYGARDGSIGMKPMLAAAEEAVGLLPADKKIFVVTESIGTGVGAHLARTFPSKIKGMVMFVPYDSLPSLAQNKMPLLLPYLFLADRFEPALWLKDYRGPIKFVIANKDQVIPPKFGIRLHDNYSGPKQLEILANAGHTDATTQSPDWWHKVFDFWNSNSQ
jgi:pimeloyl-ACP methyl ester carboxylesterase